MTRFVAVVLAWILCPVALFAQSRPSAFGDRESLKVGAEFSIFNPDFVCPSSSPFSCGHGNPLIKGVGAFADYDTGHRLGAEGEARWLRWDNISGQVETTYLVGPRVRLLQFHPVTFAAKVLLGTGSMKIPELSPQYHLSGTTFVWAPGATLDYRVTQRLALRGDYEYQRWPNFTTMITNGPVHDSGVTPNGFSIGLAYQVWGR